MSPHRGFTLIEVMVALGIVALTLVAGLKATAALATNAQRQTDMLLAGVRLSMQMPPLGTTRSVCLQAGQSLDLTLAVAATPNPNFRRVDASVHREAVLLLRVSTVVGRY